MVRKARAAGRVPASDILDAVGQPDAGVADRHDRLAERVLASDGAGAFDSRDQGSLGKGVRAAGTRPALADRDVGDVAQSVVVTPTVTERGLGSSRDHENFLVRHLTTRTRAGQGVGVRTDGSRVHDRAAIDRLVAGPGATGDTTVRVVAVPAQPVAAATLEGHERHGERGGRRGTRDRDGHGLIPASARTRAAPAVADARTRRAHVARGVDLRREPRPPVTCHAADGDTAGGVGANVQAHRGALTRVDRRRIGGHREVRSGRRGFDDLDGHRLRDADRAVVVREDRVEAEVAERTDVLLRRLVAVVTALLLDLGEPAVGVVGAGELQVEVHLGQRSVRPSPLDLELHVAVEREGRVHGRRHDLAGRDAGVLLEAGLVPLVAEGALPVASDEQADEDRERGDQHGGREPLGALDELEVRHSEPLCTHE